MDRPRDLHFHNHIIQGWTQDSHELAMSSSGRISKILFLWLRDREGEICPLVLGVVYSTFSSATLGNIDKGSLLALCALTSHQDTLVDIVIFADLSDTSPCNPEPCKIEAYLALLCLQGVS